MRAGLIAGATITLLAACTAQPEADLPDPPTAVLERPSKQPWGDTIASAQGRQANHVRDQMHDRFGTAVEQIFLGKDRASVEGLHSWYRARLGKGWQPLAVSVMPSESGFGFASGKRAIVVGWIAPMPDGRVPVTVFTYGS